MTHDEIFFKLSKMNDKNRRNYICAKVRKAIKSRSNVNDVTQMIILEADGRYCHYCPGDDFGRCEFWDGGHDNKEMRLTYCFPSFLKYAKCHFNL